MLSNGALRANAWEASYVDQPAHLRAGGRGRSVSLP